MEDNNKEKKTDVSIPPGMLSSPHIAYCVDKYQIIEKYDKSCLDSASYQMRLGGNVLTWDRGKKTEFELGEIEDKNKNIRKSVELKPNSLTFLTTIEEFQLTKDIIARYNLKSKWVHQGLLLGTGPIVDPQLHARLLIPVHNFSSQLVTMNYGEKFISVEFTKTLDPDSEFKLKSGIETKFVPNDNWDFNLKKYRERIANKIVESSIYSQIEESKEQIKLAKEATDEFRKKTETEIKRFRTINIIALSGALFAFLGLIVATWNLIGSTHEKADAAYNLVKQYQNSGVDFRAFALKSNYDELHALQNKNKEKMKSIELRIEELEKKGKKSAEMSK